MKKEIIIENRLIGDKTKPFIIAEIGQAHDGSLGLAHSYIDAVADAGADAVKFQTHIANAESTLEEEFRIIFSYEDKTRFDYWKRMEFTPEQWNGLLNHAKEKKLIFLSSPFSIEAAQLLEKIGVPAWKIGSGEITNKLLLDFISQTSKPVLISSGMSKWDELADTIHFFSRKGCPVAVFQCTSSYPVKLCNVGLNVMQEMKKRFGIPVGLSDHSGTLFPALAALALDANLIEVHVVFHKQMFGPDTSSSITLEELKFLTEARNAFWEMKNLVDKDEVAEQLKETKKLFGRSLCLKTDADAGTVITREMLTLKKPGTGIPYSEIGQIVGRKLKRPVSCMRLLKWDDMEETS